jgi:hypothetical protein
MYAMTPVNMTGGGIGWIYRKIWKQRENPNVTVVRASSFDNPMLDREHIEFSLAQYGEEQRQARISGDFLHFGGMIYPGGFEDVLLDPPSREQVKAWDVVVGIDPGLKNAAFIWVGFDRDQRAIVFDEVLLQEKTPHDYVKAIRETNQKWGLYQPLYVIDPSVLGTGISVPASPFRTS